MALHRALSRRTILHGISASIGVIAASAILTPVPLLAAGTVSTDEAPRDAYALPPLPYAFDALEPHIDAMTMQIHHDRHHQTYVTNLAAALKDYPQLLDLYPEDLIRNLNNIPETIRTAVRNNGGGHVNHAMFWDSMKAGGGGLPTGVLGGAITATFGSFDAFKQQFTTAATARFGSGWAWLTLGPERVLRVESTANQDSPLMDGRAPVLGLDVWEHAYYLKYQNRRPDYIAAWWNVVNWNAAAQRYQAAM